MYKRASKKESKIRLALFAPSGGGKTFSALRIAKGIGGKVALIDTEKGSASKYADRFDFDVAEIEAPTIENYVQLIQGARNYDVLIIDSLSHAWQELLIEIDRLTKTKYRGNSWSAWSEGTPKQKELVNAILSYPGHVIATMRVKTEWTTEVDGKGKTRPVRVGLSPEQGKGIEYEFDLLMEISEDHIGRVLKDRTGRCQDRLIKEPGEDFGQELIRWLEDGLEEPAKSQIQEQNVLEFKNPESNITDEIKKAMLSYPQLFNEQHRRWVMEELEKKPSRENLNLIKERIFNVIASSGQGRVAQ